MSAKIARLKPRVQSFETAIAAYRDGRFSACIGALAQHSSSGAVSLGARALIRLGRQAEALSALNVALDALVELSHHGRGEMQMLRATALGRLGRHIEAECAFDEARAYVLSAACPELEAEYLYSEARSRMLMGQLDSCVEGCARALAPAPAVYGSAPHVTPLAHTRSRVFQLLGAVAAARGDFVAQRCYLKMAFQEIDECNVPDLAFKAAQLANLALLARESGDVREAAFVRDRAAAVPWNADLKRDRFVIHRALGWANSLAGDYLGALRDFRAAFEDAPSTAHKIIASLDKVYLARELRQHLTAAEELEYAERLSDTMSRSDCEEDSDALLALAQALAPLQPAKGRQVLVRALRLRKIVNERHASNFDDRARTIELVAEATVCRAEGDTTRAIALFSSAFEKWKASDCSWRAALAAIELAELGAGDEYAAFARAEAERRPQSWFAERARTLPSLRYA
jgi:tetratricopeptide (TPR) repeat protein